MIPSEWHDHFITPIPKSGDKTLISNYRPISRLSSVSKVFEKLVFNKVVDFFVDSTISNSQFGFLRNRSTVKQLLLHTANIISALENNLQLDTILLDISKAFDSVPHDLLLEQLWKCGITGSLWWLFHSYLSDRCQCVRVKGQTSGWLPVCSGVPKGSILGPLLFIIYINDLPSYVSFYSTLLFADDTKVSRPISSSQDCFDLQADIEALQQWSSDTGLRFNALKSMLLRFHNSSTPVSNFDYIMNNSIIPHVSSGCDLGVIFSETLSWTDHFKLISRRAYSQLNLLKRVFAEACPSSVKRTLYLTLVRSQLTYCSQVWRPVLVKDIVTLEKIQRRATKYIVSDPSLDYCGRLVSLKLLPLMYFYELLDLLLLIQSLKNPDSSFDIKNYITFSSHGTRSGSCSKILLSHNSTNRSRHFYFYRVARLWNALPHIDLSLSLDTIKLRLKKFFWAHFLEHFKPEDSCSYHFLCPCAKCHTRTPAPITFGALG